MPTTKEIVQAAYDRHQDAFNKHMTQFRDQCLLSVTEINALLTTINFRYPAKGNAIAHYLRLVLCEALEVIRCENVLASEHLK